MYVKVKVYRLVSRKKCYAPDFTQLPPGHRTCSFVSHLSSPGSRQPGCHFQCTELIPTYKAFTVLPGTHLLLGQESARVGIVPCLGAQCRTIIQPSRGSNPPSLTCRLCTLPLSHDAPPFVCICRWNVPFWIRMGVLKLLNSLLMI